MVERDTGRAPTPTPDAVRASLAAASRSRRAWARVLDGFDEVEVSVAPSGRWSVLSHLTEWSGGPGGVACWQLVPAGGARPVAHHRPSGWVHPAVGLLWPELLPVWGRPGDAFRPLRVVVGDDGPAQVVLAAGSDRGPAGPGGCGTLHLDPRRWLCTRFGAPGQDWTLAEIRDTP